MSSIYLIKYRKPLYKNFKKVLQVLRPLISTVQLTRVYGIFFPSYIKTKYFDESSHIGNDFLDAGIFSLLDADFTRLVLISVNKSELFELLVHLFDIF